MKITVLQFPGSNCDQDCVHVLRNVIGVSSELLWHKENSLRNADAVVVPGGFSYGDYLRSGAIARFSPVMGAVREFAEAGGPVLGICNGFQILCEAGLLPGALIRNRDLLFHCEHVFLKTESANSPFTGRAGDDRPLRIPIAHGDGCFYANETTLTAMESGRQILWRYVDETGAATDAANPNGSVRNIAGVCNERRNVAGMMPHPERACESILGSTDGCRVFESLVSFLRETSKAA